MNKRIAQKHARDISAMLISVPMTMDHARPSFFALRDVGQQRNYVRARLKILGVRTRCRHRVTRRLIFNGPLGWDWDHGVPARRRGRGLAGAVA